MTGYIILGILLALSAAGNAWQYNQHTEDAVRFGTTKQLSDDTKAAASACSAGVERIEKAGRTRGLALAKAMNDLAPKVQTLEAAATLAARAKPDDPKDLCGSLDRYLEERIKAERAAAKGGP